MKAKRFFSVLLVVMMLVSCFAISASAAVTVTKPTSGSLTIHLFKGTNAIDTNDSEDGQEKIGYSTGRTPINGVVFTVTRVADNETNTTNPPAYSGTGAYSEDTPATSNGVTSLSELPAGRYFVTVKSKPTNVGDIASFLVDVPMTNPTGDGFITDVHVYPKTTLEVGTPTVDKKVAAVPDEGTITSYGDSANLKNDQAAEWQIISTIPTGFSNYSKYELTDTVSANLTIVENSLKINGSATFPTGVAASFSGKKLTVTIADPAAFAAANPSVNALTITYRTTINSYDTNAGELIPNHVTLTYNTDPAGALVDNPNYDPNGPDDETNPKQVPNDPSDPDFNDKTNNWDVPENYDGDTPGTDKDPWVWTGKLEVEKVDALNNNTKLEGVVFRISSDDPTLLAALEANDAVTKIDDVCMITTGANGTYTIPGLLDGNYTLTEFKAKDKYELNPTVINLMVENGKVTITNATDVSSFATKDGDFKVVVKNIPSTDLPLTGGMGVGMFAVLGLALAAFGGVYLFKSRKADASC